MILHMDLLDPEESRKAPLWVQDLLYEGILASAYGPGDFHLEIGGDIISLYEGDEILMNRATGALSYVRK